MVHSRSSWLGGLVLAALGVAALVASHSSVETPPASGDATSGARGLDGRGTLAQYFLEDSNVSVVEEMVNMIIGQRAYEANSRVIRAADEMLQQINQLVR